MSSPYASDCPYCFPTRDTMHYVKQQKQLVCIDCGMSSPVGDDEDDAVGKWNSVFSDYEFELDADEYEDSFDDFDDDDDDEEQNIDEFVDDRGGEWEL